MGNPLDMLGCGFEQLANRFAALKSGPVALNLIIVIVAVSATYGIGLVAKRLWGVSV